ncbi:MAG TPA: enoyl-CoA hydratase/isomerase family protein [Terriglobales bacterium]
MKAQDHSEPASCCCIHWQDGCAILELLSQDHPSRLTRSCVVELIRAVEGLAVDHSLPIGLVLTGNQNFFSAGADLNQILQLRGPDALEFARLGQKLMGALDIFPRPTFAAIRGYCMGGGLDLALACHFRFAAPNAIFGHRGAALGLITGWGGTQRLTRLVGKAQALQMFTVAAKLSTAEALGIGLITEIHEDPIAAAVRAAHRILEMRVETITDETRSNK